MFVPNRRERFLLCVLAVLLLSVVFASLYCAAPRQRVVYGIGKVKLRSDVLEVHRQDSGGGKEVVYGIGEVKFMSDVLTSTMPDSGGGQRQDKEA